MDFIHIKDKALQQITQDGNVTITNYPVNLDLIVEITKRLNVIGYYCIDFNTGLNELYPVWLFVSEHDRDAHFDNIVYKKSIVINPNRHYL